MEQKGTTERGLRVLWVTPTTGPHFGGPTTTVVNGLIAERRAGIDSELVTTIGADETPESLGPANRLSGDGVPVRLFPRTGLIDRGEAWGLSPRLAVWLARNLRKYDVLHLQYVWCMTSILGILLARLFRIPVVLTPHESLTDFDIEVASRHPLLKLMKRMLRHLFVRLTDQLVLMSRLEERDTRSDSVPVRIISHAVLEKKVEELTQREPPRNGLRIAFIGRNIEKKGIHLILEAIARHPARNRCLTIAGPSSDGDYRQRLEEIINREALSDRVEWVGFVPDRAAWLMTADVLVMPSVYEGFGMVSAEAMCVGLPVIVPEQSGVAEIVAEFNAGVVMPSSTVDNLDKALSEFEADSDRLVSAGLNGLRAANAIISFEAYAEQTGAVYRDLIRT